MDLQLKDHVVVVTGASGGLGAATARTLLAEGARVAICARSREPLEQTHRELSQVGEVFSAVADVTDDSAMSAFLDAAATRWGRVDGLVNNAGGHSSGPFITLDDSRWLADYELKMLAATRALRRLHEPLAANGGSVVNVLSVTAKTPGAGTMPTSVTRAAGLAMTKALSQEWGPDQIRVNAILVGTIRSGQYERLAQAQGEPLEAMLDRRAKDIGIPLGRAGEAEEFAALAAFLLSPRCAYLTGAAITLDGGLSPGI